MKGVVAHHRVVAEPDRGADFGAGQRDRCERGRRRRVRLDPDALRLDGPAVDLERDLGAVDQLAAVVGDAGGDGDPLLIRERRALDGDRRHREVRGLRVADVELA